MLINIFQTDKKKKEKRKKNQERETTIKTTFFFYIQLTLHVCDSLMYHAWHFLFLHAAELLVPSHVQYLDS